MAKLYRFEQKSYDAKTCAQSNLAGRTHYVDQETLKYFKSRILKCVITDDGLVLSIIESYESPYDGKRLFRPVIFNILGQTIDRVSGSDGFKTKDLAEKAMWETLNNLDAVEHTKKALAGYIESEQNNVARMVKELDKE